MKIMVAAQIFAPQGEGGAEMSARMVSLELQERHEVVVLSLGRPGDSIAPVGETFYDGIRIIRIPFNAVYLPGPDRPNSGLLTKALWHAQTALGAVDEREVSRILERENPDLIYAQNTARMQPALWQAAHAMDVPVVQHLRDYGLLCAKGTMFRRGSNCVRRCAECRLLTKRIVPASKDVATVIAVSDFVRRRYVSYEMFAAAKWHTMHNTNTPASKFHPGAVHRISHLDGRETDTITIGYLGTLSKAKGVEEIISSFARLPGNRARLVIGGRGSEDYVRKLKEMSAHYPIEFLGQVPAHHVYERADVIVSGSRWHEPQSRVLVEAAVYGVPVIATDRGGSPEIVVDNQTGWVYDPDCPDALYEALRRIVDMGKRAWCQERNRLFPGLRDFKGTAEDSKIYERLESIFAETLARHTRG